MTTYLAYDASGNQTSAAPAVNLNTASAYDSADRLVSITPTGQSATSFTLDALGRTVSRVSPAGSDAYEYVGTSQSAWRITTAGIPTSSALDPSGARLASAKGGTTGFLLADLHLNLAAAVNSAESAILAATRYDPFGQSAAAYDSGASFPTPWRFQGRLDLSPDSHPLYDFGARNYDPASGAFTALDSYAGSPGDPLSLNRYAYAEANPWTLIDPDGHIALNAASLTGVMSDEELRASNAIRIQRVVQQATSVLHANDPATATADSIQTRSAESVMVEMFTIAHAIAEGQGSRASTLGRLLASSANAAQRSAAGAALRTAGGTAWTRTGAFRLAGRGLIFVGGPLNFADRLSQGESVGEAGAHAVAQVGGGWLGATLGGLACGVAGLATAGVGGVACAAFVFGGAIAGSVAADAGVDLAADNAPSILDFLTFWEN